jgi:DNA polymerase-1
MPLLRDLEFTNMIKEYLPAEEGPAIEVVSSGELPEIRDQVFIDVDNDRVALWTGNGAIHHVGLDERVGAILTSPAIRKVAFDLKETTRKLRRRGFDIVPPYDDPMLMAFLLFPNRGKYQLAMSYSTSRHTFFDERTVDCSWTNGCDPKPIWRLAALIGS